MPTTDQTVQPQTTQPQTTQPQSAAPTTGFKFREAYLSTAQQRAALAPSELVHLSFEITLAINTALAAAPRIAELQAEIAKLPIEHNLVSKLYTYACAAGHAQALHMIATAPPEELQAVLDKAIARRATLHSDASNLAAHGLLNREAVDAIKNDVGYRNVGYDLMSLVSLMRAAATRVAGRSATLPADLDQAEEIANQLIEMAARREPRQTTDPSVAEERLRAISLMLKAYDQARRAVEFLRWDRGDADKIAPSIHAANRAGNRRRDSATPATDLPTPPAVAATLEPAAPVVPGGQGGIPFV